MPYKKSRYNVEIEILKNGSILMYNTFSGTLGVMDLQTKKVFDKIEKIDISELDDETKKNIETMINYGYIVDVDADELAAVKIERWKSIFRNDVLGLSIAPTLSCNMRCPYCYEDKNAKIMDKETQNALIDFVKYHINSLPELKTLSVFWYGGEPLLQKDTIYYLSEKLIKLCEEKEINYRATVITNGSLLDVETAKKLYYNYKVMMVQVTIDGMPQTHNLRRIFSDGSGSFDVIMENIAACREFMPISLRMNIDKNNNVEIAQLVNYIREYKGWTNNPAIYVAQVNDYSEDGKRTDVCYSSSDFANINSTFRKFQYSFNRKSVLNEFFPSRRGVFCGSECVNSFVIDPDGDCYNCWLVIGDKKHKTGNIRSPFTVNSEYAKWVLSDIPTKCEKCEYLPMCVGGCTFFRACREDGPSCPYMYYNYKDTLKLAYKDYMLQKTLKASSEN